MIELLYWTTPNGQKVLIAVEELGLPYRITPVNISKGDQFKPDFLAASPNNRIPAIIDHAPADGGSPLSVFESGACLEYLADRTGQLLPKETRARYQVLQWLYWQMGGLGPMAGQAHHFVHYAPERIPYPTERYVKEAARLYGVLDRRLKVSPYAGGDAYSIADIAIYPWIYQHKRHNQDLADFPAVQRWFAELSARPAVKKAYDIQGTINTVPSVTPDSRALLFGQGAELPKV